MNSNERYLIVMDFAKDLVNAGKALGEFQSKGLSIASTFEAQAMAIEGYISEIGKQTLCASRLCDSLGITLPQNAYNLEPIVKAYQKNPGPLSYGFVDHYGDQF